MQSDVDKQGSGRLRTQLVLTALSIAGAVVCVTSASLRMAGKPFFAFDRPLDLIGVSMTAGVLALLIALSLLALVLLPHRHRGSKTHLRVTVCVAVVVALLAGAGVATSALSGLGAVLTRHAETLIQRPDRMCSFLAVESVDTRTGAGTLYRSVALGVPPIVATWSTTEPNQPVHADEAKFLQQSKTWYLSLGRSSLPERVPAPCR